MRPLWWLAPISLLPKAETKRPCASAASSGSSTSTPRATRWEIALQASAMSVMSASKSPVAAGARRRSLQAKLFGGACVLRAFKGQPPYPTPTANSACFSPVSSTQASWLTAVYQYKQDTTTGAWRCALRLTKLSTLCRLTWSAVTTFRKLRTKYSQCPLCA